LSQLHCPATLTPGIGGWVGFRAGLGAVEKRKILPLPRIETLPVSISTELSRLSKISHIELKKKNKNKKNKKKALSTDLSADTVS
jgi:hypothetical protein